MSTAQQTTAEVEIRAFVESWLNAYRSKDPDALVAHYIPNGRAFTLAPPLEYVNGDERQRAFTKEWFSGFEDSMEFSIRDLEIEIEGDLAYCLFFMQLAATPVGDQRFSFWYRITLGLRKVDGRWKISHEHESVPFHMDGRFRAAVELQPA